jgi:stearoyl-CoA desaturase (delta-9 desaturase)
MPSLRKRFAEPVVGAAAPEDAAPASADNPFRRPPQSREAQLRAAGIEAAETSHAENRFLNAISIGTPLIGTAAALVSLPFFPPTAATFWVFVIFFVLNGFGITLGLHRYFTHRAFETSPIAAWLLGVFGTWAFQGPIVRWVADHRRHHRFSDREFDPHSPYWDDRGPITSKLRGFLHAHLLWMLTGLRSSEDRYASDIRNSGVANWLSRRYWTVAASGIALPAAAGYVVGGLAEAVACALWAGFARVALLHQLTWSVNSFGHMVGKRQDGASDQARDNPLLAAMILGEGLHGFHHRYPGAAVKAPIALDATGALILLLEKIGVVWNVSRAVRDHAPVSAPLKTPRAPGQA